MEVAAQQNSLTASKGGVPASQNQEAKEAKGIVVTEENANNVGLLPTIKKVMSQPAVKRSMPAISVLIAVLFFVVFGAILNSTGYQSISNGMTESDRQASYEVLTTGKFDVRINPASGMVEVPDGVYQEAKMFLAAQGLPRSSIVGGYSSLNDNASMTTSQFMEQVRYNNAMELELAKTISEIDTIESARVHIAVNKQSVFLRDRMPSKASVVLKPYFGRVVSQPQVQSIVHLVSSSVPYMSSTDVTVVDNYGNLLSSENNSDSLGTAKNIDFERRMEAELSERIIELIMPVVGEGNVKSIVNVDIDFTEVESTYEEFDRNGQGPKTRSEILSTDAVIGKAAGGIPGGTSNIAPDDANLAATGAATTSEDASEQSSRSQTTRNYELDKAVRYVKEQPGRVLGLTAAVMVNEKALRDVVIGKMRVALGFPAKPSVVDLENDDSQDANDGEQVAVKKPEEPVFTEEQIISAMEREVTRFRNLITLALPFNAERGDNVNISTAPFYVDAPIKIEIPWWEQEGIVEWGKHGFTVIAFLFLLSFVVRPVMSFYIPKPQDEEDMALLAEKLKDGELSEADLVALEQGESLEEIKAKLKPKKSSISADMLDTANSYDDKVALIRLLVAEDSGRVANVLKKMIKPV